MAAALAEAASSGLRPIIVGGTGLYFGALTLGLAPVPPVPAEVRAAWRGRSEGMPTTHLHRLLAERSAPEAARVRPTDRARILRALEVIDATGRPLPEWQAAATPPLVGPARAERIVLVPDRAELHRRIAARFRAMTEAGAVAEAEAMSRLGLDPSLPAMKALGLRPLLRHLGSDAERTSRSPVLSSSGEAEPGPGDPGLATRHGSPGQARGRQAKMNPVEAPLPLEAAVEAAIAETRQYAKRQLTWFRHQMADWPVAAGPDEAAARL